MKKQNIFFGIILIGIGTFYFLNQLHIHMLDQLYTWPTILIFIGLALFVESKVASNPDSLFPATILTGLGIHFHAVHYIHHWPTGWPVYLFIVGLAFLVRYSKTKKSGLFTGLILVTLAILGLFNQFVETMLHKTYHYLDELWPILLIVVGLYIIIKKK